MELNKDFREFVELLNEHGVKYLIIGGYAVNFMVILNMLKTLIFGFG
jgi:hypothetical protein